MKTFITVLIIGFFLFILSGTGLAQIPPPPLPAIPKQAPIDGGLGLLAAAGGAYAWKKLRARRKE